MIIRKIERTNNDTANIVYVNNNGDTIKINGADIMHRDFKACFNDLAPLFASITEQREASEAGSEEHETNNILDKIRVTKVAFNEEYFTLHGLKALKCRMPIKIETPRLCDSEEYFAYRNELVLCLERLKYEAKEYVLNKKIGVEDKEAPRAATTIITADVI